MSTTNQALQAWVEEVARLTRPDRIHWCDGSEAEYRGLVDLMLGTGDLVALTSAVVVDICA